MFGIDLTTFQQMQALVAGGMDTTVDAILNAQKRLKKGVGEGSVKDTIKSLRVQMNELVDTGDGILEIVPKDANKLFFELGQAILNTSDAFDKEAAAQKLFGRSWQELVPLFSQYKTYDDFTAALQEQNTVSEESVEDLAAMNDAFGELQQNFLTLKREVEASIAPALTDVANALSGVLDSVLTYLQTDEGKAMLESMGTAITELFSGLQGVKAEDVVSGFKTAFDAVTGALQWIVDNKDGVMTALEAVFGLWGTFKVAEGVLTVAKVIEGITGLSSGAAAMGEAAGASWGSGFAGAVMKAAPWLIGLYTLLNPASGSDALGNNDLIDENGNVTEEGKSIGMSQEWAKLEYFLEKITKLSNELDKSSIRGNTSLSDAQISALQSYWFHYSSYRGGNNSDYTRNSLQNASEQLIQLFGANNPQLAAYRSKMEGLFQSGYNGNKLDTSFFNIDENGVEVPVNLQAPANAAVEIAEQVGTVPVKVRLMMEGLMFPFLGGHANGLPFVQNDGLAYLHKGERVLTASQNRNYTYNSNNYFGNVNLNNGQDIEALCDTIDRRNRRRSVGYGA